MNRFFAAAATTTALVAFAASAQTAVNASFTYQGKLVDSGQPVSGPVTLTFRMYTAAAGGTLLGTQVVAGVPVTQGLFTVTLNGANQFGSGVFDGTQRWLEIEHGGVTLTPRQPLTAVPYASKVPGIDGHSLNAADNSPLDALFVNNDGYVGIGSLTPTAPLSIKAVSISGSPSFMSLRNTSDSERWRLGLVNNELAFRDVGNGVDRVRIGDTSSKAMIVSGTLTTNVLEILGGSDIAEPFEIAPAGADGTQPLPGMVVTIDPERIGALRVAQGAYDRTVAGIVSGANGVNVGMTLKQPGTVADGSHPVALTGRVWCWVDADQGGSVAAGDLLTTSPTAGHAMKVNDHERASGAVIGKAMSSLERGRGLVLVLVNLQ